MNIYDLKNLIKLKRLTEIELRVAFYARVSTEKEEQAKSIENQADFFRELITSNPNWTLSGEYIDEGITGTSAKKRKNFLRMIEDAKRQKFDLIITKEISRFARNTLDSIRYTQDLLSYGVAVLFELNGFSTVDKEADILLPILASLAQSESQKTSERVKFGHAQAIKKGSLLGTDNMYGYRRNNGQLQVVEKEAEMIRYIFSQYASGESSTNRISNELFVMGYRSHKGGKIDSNVIKSILQNPKYKGFFCGGKVKVIDMMTKKQLFIPQENWNMYEDFEKIPPIVDSDLWETANEIYRERSHIIKNRRSSIKLNNLFTGMIFCTEDQAPYWLKSHKSRDKEENPAWVCSHKIKNGTDSCKSIRLMENELLEIIVDILQIVGNDSEKIIDDYIQMFKKVYQNNNSQKALDKVQAEIEQYKLKSKKLFDLYANEMIGMDEFKRHNAEIEEELKEVQKKANEIEEEQRNNNKVIDMSDLSKLKHMLKECMHLQKEDLTKEIITSLIDRIYVTPVDQYHIKLDIKLKSGRDYEVSRYVEDGRKKSNFEGCSGIMVKKMIEEQERKMAGK